MAGRSEAAANGYGVAQRRHHVATVLLMVVGVALGGLRKNTNFMVHSWTLTTTGPISRQAALQQSSPLRTINNALVRTGTAGRDDGDCSRRRTVLRSSDDADATVAASENTATTPSLATIYTLDGQELNGPLTAVSNRIVVKVRDTLTATSGGILLPDQSQQRPTEGFVLVSGPGRVHPHSGVRIPNPIQPGMSVV
jgi:chaperonin GroES